MSELLDLREQKLNDIGKFKRGLALPIADLQLLDNALKNRWGIDFIHTDTSLYAYLEQLPPCKSRDLGMAAFQADLNVGTSASGDQHLYEAMADPELCGIVTSSRRHYLLDAIALACVLYRHLELSGPVLDVGCHVGVAPELMAEILGVPAIGLEPVGAAVDAAKSCLAKQAGVSIVHGAFPWATEAKFELITVIDAMPLNIGERGIFLSGLAKLLHPGGIALIVSSHWVKADVFLLRRQLADASLGFGFADVVGGFGSMPTSFNAEGSVCLIKGAKQQFPRKISAVMESEWEWFKDFANAETTPAREKTQAFMRTNLRKV